MKKRSHANIELIDKAKQRMMFDAFLGKVKNVGLFLFVTVVLTWLVLGVL